MQRTRFVETLEVKSLQTVRTCLTVVMAGLLAAAAAAQEQPAKAQPAEAEPSEDGREILELAADHMQQLEMRRQDGDVVERVERPVLTYGDQARANKNGTV